MEKPNSNTRADARLWKWTLAGWTFLLVIWLLQNVVGESWWPAVWPLYLPAHWIGVPAAILSVWSLLRRQKKAIFANVAALLVWFFVFLGFNIPLQKLRRESTASRGKVRVLTYNIHYGSDGAKNIARVIRDENPDIICLQETRAFAGWPDPMPALKTQFPQYQMRRAGEVAILSRQPLSSAKQYSMPARSGRKLLESVVEIDGRKLRVLVAHIATGTGDISALRHPRAYTIAAAKVRREHLETLLEKSAGSKLPTIIAGDFNNPPRGLAYRRLQSRYTDSFRAAGWGLGYSFHAALPVLRIDYIWADPIIRVLSCRTLGASASDHRPVVADIALPDETNRKNGDNGDQAKRPAAAQWFLLCNGMEFRPNAAV